MQDFYRTAAGRKFYDADIPKLTKVLERIADQMEKSNHLEEKRFRLDEKRIKLQIKNLNENSQ